MGKSGREFRDRSMARDLQRQKKAGKLRELPPTSVNIQDDRRFNPNTGHQQNQIRRAS